MRAIYAHGFRAVPMPPDVVTGWRRFRVERLDGTAVGWLVEHHEWRGWRCGPAMWVASHKPGEEACWNSYGTPAETMGAALSRLAAHLDLCLDRPAPVS